ncbi:drug resistance transporter, EmrB/QacA subfamily [Parvibaculum lavamentivorans DS-1]|uniref:Drug resistance transporter, EmrB/QacA subfamily n=1 Tax=Parvibaculum lavamentivorans (strain DS-1 / DSM 13023 / NCIMB 13966) TaxID=402881 RepID=A7HVP0_PARL1|nr:MFS transporter [Parvibaculum lavamentivorans]ABS63973.1 drug resistance transporter, EmrB/QacA subfamily [Parvibaculum lavamentivorans DS-1]
MNLAAFPLVVGILLAALTEAVAGTVLATARFDMIGDIYATTDEFSRLDVVYAAAKLTGFVLSPWLLGKVCARTCLRAATGAMTLACGAAALTFDLDILVGLRLLQGAAGGVLLVSGQTMLFQTFPRSSQPVVQCFFAMGAVVAPATLAPYMEGWLVDSLAWTWIFLSIVPIGLAALVLLVLAQPGAGVHAKAGRPDWPGLLLFSIAAYCLTYVLSQGSRWQWLEELSILRLMLGGTVSLTLFMVYQLRAGRTDALLDLSIFRFSGFAFGFVASIAAGIALAGSTYLIQSFVVTILGMTLTAAGRLLLPGALAFIGTLLLTALLVQRHGIKPIATVPLGIIGLMVAMWMLSGSTGESGFPDLMPAVLLRGLALGFLFLSITLITLLDLPGRKIAYGVALFNVGRQTGGLFGVAFLETLIDHQTALNRSVLTAHIVPGRVAVTERLAALTDGLAAHGVELDTASRAAVQILARELTMQASVIAFDTAFFAVALFFVGAAPVLVTVKIVLGRISGREEKKMVGTPQQVRSA